MTDFGEKLDQLFLLGSGEGLEHLGGHLLVEGLHLCEELEAQGGEGDGDDPAVGFRAVPFDQASRDEFVDPVGCRAEWQMEALSESGHGGGAELTEDAKDVAVGGV